MTNYALFYYLKYISNKLDFFLKDVPLYMNILILKSSLSVVPFFIHFDQIMDNLKKKKNTVYPLNLK